MVELEAVSDAAVETLQRTFNDAIDNMIPKMPNLADMSDKLNDLRLRQTRRVETRRASSRVTGLVRSLHDVVSNGNFGAMIWKTDDILSISMTRLDALRVLALRAWRNRRSFNLLDMSARLGILGIMLSITSLN
ncbi:Hypothetical predicted protein [Prunus dulcis]|uniref:Uncharacterized protein n=1 Tax=Prunus dulcis TaxID=3755 RepID=A0A5E4EFL1_PRUDU|nr:Hypothetical predicted protein [Prunus dulcis]